MAYFKTVVFLTVLACVAAEFKFKESLKTTLQSCKGGVDVTDHDINEFCKPLIPETPEEKCLMACVMRAYNIINDKHFDPKIYLSVVQEILKEYPERVELTKNILDHCGDDIPKTMDDECELASEIMQCEVKYKNEKGTA